MLEHPPLTTPQSRPSQRPIRCSYAAVRRRDGQSWSLIHLAMEQLCMGALVPEIRAGDEVAEQAS